MTDKEIIKGLIEKDNRVTREFFFENCRPLFCKVINYVFNYKVDYDEFVNELYVYLMEDNAQKLKDFDYRCSVYMWLKILAIRYFIKKKKRMIDINPVHSLFNRQELITNEENNGAAKDDLERLLGQMPTLRYAYIIRKLLIEDNEPTSLAKEMNITTANLYNIKHRAMVQLTQVALKDIKEYGK